MDKKRGIKNVSVSVLFKILLLVGSLLIRRYLIRYIGNEINGLNSLYLSILNVLSVAELGLDSAIIFCMYKPVVDGDKAKVSALYGLFTGLYLIFAVAIVVGGCALLPALPYLAKDHANTGVNLYLTFGLMLISVVMSYMFSSKTSLVNAYKNNYISTTIQSSGLLLQYVLQIIVLVTTQSFVFYLICRIVAVAVQWGVTEIVARKKYGDIIRDKQAVDAETKKVVTKNVKAMFMHKVGYVLVNTVDSIVISAFIGVGMLGGYTNYTAIVTSMVSVITLCFTPLTSVIGHMFVEESTNNARRYFKFFHTFNFVLAVVFFLGYYSIIDNLVAILFGSDLVMARSIAMVITVNYFIQFMRRSTILFRDASGTFYNNRWMPICEGLLNVALSILFVKVFPEQYNIVGVIVATIITNLFICHIVEPHVLYKYALKSSPKWYYDRNYGCIAIFTATMFALHFSMVSIDNQWLELLANGFISVAFSLGISAAVALMSKDFRHYMKNILHKLFKRSKPAMEAVAVSDDSTAAVEEHFAETQTTISNPDAESAPNDMPPTEEGDLSQ